MEEIKLLQRDDLCLRCGEISCTLNFDEALQAILEAVEACLNTDASSVLLLDPSGLSFSVAAARNLSEDYVKREPIPLEKDLTGRKILQDQVVAMEDLSMDPAHEDLIRSEGMRSALVVPLKSKERIVGALWAFSRERRRFTADETSYLAAISAQGGVTLGNARLHSDLHVIAGVGRAVTSRRDLQEILRLIVESGTSVFSAKGASVYLTNPEEDTLEMKASYGVGNGFFEKKVFRIDDAIRNCLEQIVVISDLSRGQAFPFPEDLAKEEVRSVICMPLRIKGSGIGVLRLYLGQVREFTDEEQVLLEILADFGAIAIENARLFDHIKRDYQDLTRDVWHWYGWGERPPKM